jgi:type VI protein secretion system component Hcp
MKTLLLAIAALVLFSPHLINDAAAAVYLEIDGVKGESSQTAERTAVTSEPTRAETTDDRPSTTTIIATDIDDASATGAGTAPTMGTVAAPGTGPQEASVDAFLKIDGVEGESTKKGNVEFEWKVEEGESAPAEPGVTDVTTGGQAVTPDFSILLGGGSDDDEATASRRDEVAGILKQGMEEAGMPVEQISLNVEKIKTKVAQEVRLFGIIPVRATATVEIDAENRVKVKYPWWSFLASGKDAEGLGERIFTTLSNVLKTKHDTVKNAIGNVR